MFESATLKLTTWYLAILIAISLIFSIIIYSIASTEVGARLDYLQARPDFSFNNSQALYKRMRDNQVHEAQDNLLGSLLITNICIWIAGGIGSYYLARRTLRPIEEAHEAQSRFTSDASHELRTPLASMKTELEVALRDSALAKGEMRELLESNLEEVDKLTKLSQTLLQLSRLDHENIERKRIALDEVITSVVNRLDKKGERIQISNKDSSYVFANGSNVEELLTILLDNALKYSPIESTVSLSLTHQKGMSGFAVTNTGKGIPAAVLPHIFDRFYRADSSRTGGEKKGYGLGLSLAKKIVELHGGELTVSSAPNRETTFRVLLPNFTQVKAKNQN
jgi:two-component system sensor histidine kinase CiaH